MSAEWCPRSRGMLSAITAECCPPSTWNGVRDHAEYAHEPRERGDYAWTWRIQSRDLGLLENHLTALVKTGDPRKVAQETHHWTRFYPMFGGVRRQLRRTINSGQKLWGSLFKERAWPGPDPDHLPAMVGFKKDSSKKI